MGHFPIQFRGKELERKLRLRQLSCLLGSDEVAELEFIRYEFWGLWGHGDDSDPAQTLAHLLPSHGFEHLLQLNSQLLSVVHEDAGLQMGARPLPAHLPDSRKLSRATPARSSA